MKLDFAKYIFDPVLGFIPLTKKELEIVDHPLFQRLRKIKQLGNADRVFPGATHTRFTHSLGVMYIAGEIANKFADDYGWRKDDIIKIRLAGLLHDIGHYPYSHLIEKVYENRKGGLNHEELGREILKNSSLKDIIGRNDTVDEISSIFLGRHHKTRFNQLMHSELDADRMDYLLRDSYHTGVEYGRFDFHQLLRRLQLSDDGCVCVDERALGTADHYLIARFHMYTRVCTHKTIRSFDVMLKELASNALEKEMIPTPRQLTSKADTDTFRYFDDHQIDKLVREIKSKGSKRNKEIAGQYLDRKPLKCAIEETYYSVSNPDRTRSTPLERLVYLEELTELSFAGIPREWIFWDTVDDLRVSKACPVIQTGFDDTQNAIQECNPASGILIRNAKGERIPLSQHGSSLIHHLGQIKYEVCRVYTHERFRKKLASDLSKKIRKAKSIAA